MIPIEKIINLHINVTKRKTAEALKDTIDTVSSKGTVDYKEVRKKYPKRSTAIWRILEAITKALEEPAIIIETGKDKRAKGKLVVSDYCNTVMRSHVTDPDSNTKPDSGNNPQERNEEIEAVGGAEQHIPL